MSNSVRAQSQVESLQAENALLERRIAEYLEGRNSLKASVAEAIQFLEDQCEQKRKKKEATKQALEEVKKERKALVDLLYSLEGVPERVDKKQQTIKLLYDQIQSSKDFIAQQKIGKSQLVTSRSSTNLASSSSSSSSQGGVEPEEKKQKKETDHTGITVEGEECQMIQRLGITTMKAASPPKLVEWLSSGLQDSQYFSHFALTFRSFMSCKSLMERISELYRTMAEREAGMKEERVKERRLRLVNFVRFWVEGSFEQDFMGDKEMQEALEDFARLVSVLDGSVASSQLVSALTHKLSSRVRRSRLTFSSLAPDTVSFDYSLISSLFDISPLETARQITIKDSEVFRKIQPKEYLDGSWSSESLAPNIFCMIERFNQLSARVASSIVTEAKVKARAVRIQHWIDVAVELEKLNNFNSMMAVLASLSQGAVHRLHKTWKKVAKSKIRQRDDLEELMSSNANHKTYRSRLRQVNPPLVPYLGLYLKDLVFIQDGNPNRLANGYVNFSKCRQIGERIEEMINYQQAPYNLVFVQEIEDFLSNLMPLDEESLYQLSLHAEPRRTPVP